MLSAKENCCAEGANAPLLEKYRFLKEVKIDSRILDPTPPSIFVGRIGYPKVCVGPLVSLNVDPVYADSPWLWKRTEDVIRLRTSLLRVSRRFRVEDVREKKRELLELQEMTAAIKPMEVEAEIEKVNRKAEFDDVMQPMGYSAIAESIRLAENPKIPDKVEKVYYDDMKAFEGLKYLYDRGFSTYYLQKIFSAGILGERKRESLSQQDGASPQSTAFSAKP